MQRILFIDDDVLSLQLMSRATSMLGFQSILSTSPRRGLRIAADEKPSLILVDMRMDEMDGDEFVRQVRGLPELAALPVVVCTAGTAEEIEPQARAAGATAFIQKPLCLNQLLSIIQTYSTAV